MSIRISESVIKKLEVIAQKNGLKPADIVRLAIDAALVKMEEQGGLLFSLGGSTTNAHNGGERIPTKYASVGRSALKV